MRSIIGFLLLCSVGCASVVTIEDTDGGVDAGEFEISIVGDGQRLVRGNSVTIEVTVSRGVGFEEEVGLEATGLPNGYTTTGTTVPATTDEGQVTITAPASADLGQVLATVRGSAGDLQSMAELELMVADPPGTLDESFGGDGSVIRDDGDGPVQLAVSDADSTVVAAYTANLGGTSEEDWVFARVGLDASELAVETTLDLGILSDVAIQSNGRVLVSGRDDDAMELVPVVIRRTSDLKSDDSFGGDGRADLGGSAGNGLRLAVSADDTRIALAATIASSGRVIMLNNQGLRDMTFGTAGTAIIEIPGRPTLDLQTCNGVAFTPDGGLAMTGGTFLPLNAHVYRYTGGGSPLATFGDAGARTIVESGADEVGHAVAVTDDGTILVAGEAGAGYFIARVTSAGIIDVSFGNGPIVDTILSATAAPIEDMIVQPDGRVVGVGTATIDGNRYGFAVRYQSTGSLDGGFANGGKLVSGTSGGLQVEFRSVDQLPDGRLVIGGKVSGSANPEGNGPAIFRVWD